MKTVKYTKIQVDEKTYAKLETRAKEKGVTVTEYVTQLVNNLL